MRGIGLGLAVALLAVGATPALAGGGHEALLAAPAAKARIVVHDIAWQCDGTRCIAAAESNSRPVIVCMALTRAVGPVLAFSTGGAALKEADLARCNATREQGASVSSR